MTIGGGGPAAPPGWYPEGPGWERRWDGFAWTADRRPAQPAQPAQPSPWAPPAAGAPASGSAPPTAYPPASSPPPTQPPAGFAQGPPPSYPAPPRQKKSLLWLWVALAVVLIVVIATVVTLVVVQPWADDDTDSGGKGGGEETTEPTEPPPAESVRGDLDGDGRGDVLGRFYDSTESRLTLTNKDGSFQLGQEPVPQEENLIVADFDGDGSGDVGSWFDAAGTLQFEIEDSDLPSVTQEFELWFKVQAIRAAFGDFDGDGLTDIAAYGQQHRSQVAVWVLRNNGEGFEQPEKWAALPNATYGSTELIVGDFNGDGSDDVMAVVPDEPLVRGDFDSLYWYGDFGVVPLIAESGSFDRGGIGPVETELFDQEYAVGDFDGDGRETLAADNYYEDSFLLYEYDGTTLRPTGATVNYGVAGDGLLDAVVAVDLNGDQLDDLVFTSVDIDDYSSFGAWVATSDAEGGIDTPTKWSNLPKCTGEYCEVDYFVAR